MRVVVVDNHAEYQLTPKAKTLIMMASTLRTIVTLCGRSATVVWEIFPSPVFSVPRSELRPTRVPAQCREDGASYGFSLIGSQLFNCFLKFSYLAHD